MRHGGRLLLAGAGLDAYSVAIEPNFLLNVARYKISPAGWPRHLRLRIAVISDLHACDPWMPTARVARIVAATNALEADLIVLLGDFSGGVYLTQPVAPEQWGAALAGLRAPLGVYAILGNHDWWHGARPEDPSDDAAGVRRGLKRAGATLLENDTVLLFKGEAPFWLLGLGDQMAYPLGKRRWGGHDDLTGTLAKIGDEKTPAILLAHEPFVFASVPRRIALTLAGHTHGGQINLPFAGPIFAELRYRTTHVYGHIFEDDRHLIISGGLGVSNLPMRFMRPPEIVEVAVGASEGSAVAAGAL